MSVRLVPAASLALKPRLGVAALTRRAFDGESLDPLWADLVARLKTDNGDVEAAMDLSAIAQLAGRQELGFQLQAQALQASRLYRSPCGGARPRLTLLAFAAVSDIGGNTPLEFLLEGQHIALYTLYVVPGMPLPEALPDHDAAFVAVPESDATRATLDEIQRLAFSWPRPVLNLPRRIAELERDRLHRLLAGAPGIAIPATARIDRDDLTDVLDGESALGDLFEGAQLPLIVRPVGSQAGRGLERLDDEAAIRAYLENEPAEDFFVSPFIDYSGEDGLYRKYRIVFIDGKAYACHMAVSDQWKLWYLNADMEHSAAKRAEEARFMTQFDQGFGARHAAALREIAQRTGLDYFAIDCGESKDGALLIFEADVAMIVHNMDPAGAFPYKAPQMQRIFAAFAAMLEARAARAAAA